MIKRSLDIALAILLLVLSLPLLAVAALLIKWDSEGPVLFFQERMGRGFKPFQLFKLRTMRHLISGSAITLGADPRITRVGRWLRFFKLDELPQLWNVLRGDMSMVGPRPVIPQLAREFKRSYERLLTARPGLTDPATLKYCRETEMLAAVADPMHYFKTVVTPDKLLISQLYQERATVFNDLCVLAATGLVLLLPAESTKLIPVHKNLAPVLAFPTHLPAAPLTARLGVPLAARLDRGMSETCHDYRLDLPRRDGFGRLRPSGAVLHRSGHPATPDRASQMRLVP